MICSFWTKDSSQLTGLPGECHDMFVFLYPVDGQAVSGFGSGNPMSPSQLTVNPYEEDSTENSSTMSGIFGGDLEAQQRWKLKVGAKIIYNDHSQTTH